MVRIVFYEKPGCIGNRRQKQILQDAGADLDVRNLLTQHWNAEQLKSFFGDMAVADWFNRSAPSIKAGVIDPDGLSAGDALAAMMADPLLIRRPLIEMGDVRCCGFSWPALAERLQLNTTASVPATIETCPRDQADTSACHAGEADI